MSIIGTIYEDVTTDVLGLMGTWQWLVTMLLTVLMMPAMLNQYEDMFLLKPTNYIKCELPEIHDIVNSSLCSFTILNNISEEVKCNKWRTKLLGIIWLKKSWLIFCDDKFKLLSTTIICRLGFVFGCIIFGLISDSFGRKRVITINIVAESFFGLILTFCDSEAWFHLLIFLRSLFASGYFYTGIILICEIASNSWRTYLITIVTLPRVFAIAYIVPMANSLPNLETFNFMACVFCLVCIILLRWLPESPHWLLYSRKVFLAEKILFKAALKNKIKLCSDFKIRPVNHKAYNCLDENRTCINIFYTYNSRIIVIFSLIFWTLYNFLWSYLYVKTCTDDRMLYIEVLVFFGILECITLLLLKKFKLKHILLINVTIMGTLTTGILIFNRLQIKGINISFVHTAALSTGMMGHTILLNITPRLFAINVRATIFGCCHSSGQLGTIICYLLYLLDYDDHKSLIFVQIGATFMLTALCYVIPDVDGRELPDIVEDMDYFSELSKPLRWVTQKTNSPSQEEVEMRIYSFGSTVRNSSINSHSAERIPARAIGFKNLWQSLVSSVRHELR
ncbi:PREDICTED: solute carrier family 22 member 4-like [Papilio xuthus]|uniref:Solute carrier family 22 member 4-like n=1 Tax=Papilio xuthus TaxID=66420 RepID=A0AAJ6ZIK6_PAPXU|nr:PREDICTED: solute carrier family 22 member 4-like [Papilio xuthus]